MPKGQQPDSTTYLLRDVPKAIWRRARAKAIINGRSMRDVIVELLDQWADLEGGFIEPTARRRKRKK